jgi:hypothetical protein
MKSNRLHLTLLALIALALPGVAWAQSSGTVNDAFQVAKSQVAASVQTKVVSCYGIGTPTAVQKWYIIFYDPTVASHGRAVLVENNQVTKTYAANGGKTYTAALSFDPSRITSEGPALAAAQGYAARHHMAYDSVTALLHQTAVNKPFRWKIGLVDVGENKGYVYVNALDDTVAAYSSAKAPKMSTDSSTPTTAAGVGEEVKHTFLGIGGDLQEFFTGERTVDK